jgi:hypothetical protein
MAREADVIKLPVRQQQWSGGGRKYFVTSCCREGTVSSVPYLKLPRSSNLAATVGLHNTQVISDVSFIHVFKTNFIANANASSVITPGW